MVEKDVEELRYKFDKYNEDFRNRLNDPSCTITECEKIRQEIRNENGFFGTLIKLLEIGVESDVALTDKYVSLCEELAVKLHELGNSQAALDVINDYDVRVYVPEDNPDYAGIKSGLDQLEGRIRHVIDLKNRFIEEIKDSTAQLKDANCDLSKCYDIREKLQRAAVKLKGANGFSKELSDKYVNLCKELATKLHLFGNSQVALDVIESAIKCIGNTEGNSSILEELNRLKESFKKKSEPIPVKLILAIVAVLVIAAGGYFVKEGGIKDPKPPTPPTPPPVTISFDVPEGTKIVFDGKDVSGQKELQVSVGSHDIQLEHPLLDLDYDKKINISKQGGSVVIKNIKPGANLKMAAEKVNLAMMNEILQQACTSDSMQFSPSIFSANADQNGMIKKFHNGMHSYATNKKIKSFLPVAIESSTNPVVEPDGKSVFVKQAGTCIFTVVGGHKASYSISSKFIIQNGNILVVSLDKYENITK